MNVYMKDLGVHQCTASSGSPAVSGSLPVQRPLMVLPVTPFCKSAPFSTACMPTNERSPLTFFAQQIPVTCKAPYD